MIRFNGTTVGVDDSGLHESHFEIMQDCRFVQVAEGSEVVLPHQDVRVAKRRELRVRRVNGEVVLLYSGRLCKRRQVSCYLLNAINPLRRRVKVLLVLFYLQCHLQEVIQEYCPQNESLSEFRPISTHVLHLVSTLCCTKGKDVSGVKITVQQLIYNLVQTHSTLNCNTILCEHRIIELRGPSFI